MQNLYYGLVNYDTYRMLARFAFFIAKQENIKNKNKKFKSQFLSSIGKPRKRLVRCLDGVFLRRLDVVLDARLSDFQRRLDRDSGIRKRLKDIPCLSLVDTKSNRRGLWA